MSSEMIERVAKALCGCNAPNEEPWNELGLREQQDYRRMARTAIEAMREPTEDMRRAALGTNLPDRGEPPLYEKVWRNMLASALGEQP